MTTYGTCWHQIAKMVLRSLFLFPVYKRHFVFITVIIIYLCRTYVLWIGRRQKCRSSRWNFTNMLFRSQVISISGLQAPFCFFPSNHYLFASGIHPLNRAPPKIGALPLEFHKYLVPIRSYFYFRFTSAICFLRWSLSICVGHTSFGLGAPENVGIAAGTSQICYS